MKNVLVMYASYGRWRWSWFGSDGKYCIQIFDYPPAEKYYFRGDLYKMPEHVLAWKLLEL